ncbi:ABC transporter substrate-binding protein [Sporichthya brevicatena]|uniref:ABC transporter substrate-binding protein n=1 Tax=Sporichthya brevicatena TaxID=171442 RepID=UPI0031D7E271
MAAGQAGQDAQGAVPELAADGSVAVPGATGADPNAAAPGAAAANPNAAANPGAAAANPNAATNPNAGGGAANAKGGAKANAGGGSASGGATGTAALANLPIFGGKAACKPATGTPINIGNVSTLSGVLGELFSPVVPALQIFVASQNACGGLNGHPIKLFIADDQGDPATAVTEGRKMIQNNKILAFLGNIQVLTVDGIIKVVNETGIPIIGGDLTNNTWFTQPLLFPQGSPPQSIAYGYLNKAKQLGAKKVGNNYCLEVPQACTQINRAFEELAPKFGVEAAYQVQISITSPDYTPQCIAARNAGVTVMAQTNDAPTQNRFANSCAKVGYKPQWLGYPLGVGNEAQFLGNPNLGGTYVPMNHFPWMAGKGQFPGNAAMQYYQQAVAKFRPGYNAGGAASLGWQAGALLVAASTKLTENPTTAQFLDALYEFKGQKFTELGGLSGPLTFNKGGTPKVPYCLYGATSDKANKGWGSVDTKLQCTDVIAPSDPQSK